MSARRTTTLILLGALTLLATGCSRTYYSDVPEPQSADNQHSQAQIATPGSAAYTVQRGDSLYKISFVTGQDWREIARINNIAPPYTIYPGQVLVLRPSLATSSATQPKTTVRAAPETAITTTPAKPASKAPAVAITPKKAAPAVVSQPPTPAKAGAWVWPSSGKLFHRFSTGAQPHKGIDLAGTQGDPVYAANNGTVVYAGNSVRGYGNMLIIKHNATYLSAYAHNSRLLVGEGQTVTAGQKIAEFGDSGTDRVKLHFEVRKNGNPVDPLTVLPRR